MKTTRFPAIAALARARSTTISPRFTSGTVPSPSPIESETAYGSNSTPARPAAATIRPQFGSSP